VGSAGAVALWPHLGFAGAPSGRHLAGWDVNEQTFLEALGRALAFEGFAQAVDIQDRTCVLRNDAAASDRLFPQWQLAITTDAA
jgi:hypothetical protein